MQVLMSNEAHEDIDSIFEYISRDSIKYANETSENIYSRIYELENAPYLGRYVPELSDKHFRELIYKSYRMIFLKIQILFTYILSFMAKEILNHFINLTLKIIFNSNYY